MKIVVGLGNPGRQYEKTCHNAGFLAVSRLVKINFQQTTNNKQQGKGWFEFNKKLKSEIAEGEIDDDKVLLVKPMTFMNRSGEAVASILNFYKIEPEDLILVHDDADLPLGKIKIQKGGGSAGHHGIESIIKAVGSDFTRIRIGVRIKEGKAMDFILKRFNKEQEKTLEKVLEKTAEAIKVILEEGVEKAMNKYNGETYDVRVLT